MSAIPEDLFKVQAEVYGLYHMTNPEVFFNREDLWTVATETGTDSNGQQTVQMMQPNFVLMKLPGGTGEEFVEILPFTPANRNNLIGWIAGRSDGAKYGTAVVYNFPKTRLIDGPQQIEARIDQNAQLSGQLTLWNQQGSHVLRGSLLVIPIWSSTLVCGANLPSGSAKPNAGAAPCRACATRQARLRHNISGSAGVAFRGRSLVAECQGTAASLRLHPEESAQPSSDINALISEASKDFADYQRLTAEGKLGEAGLKLDALKNVLDRLNAHLKSRLPPFRESFETDLLPYSCFRFQ